MRLTPENYPIINAHEPVSSDALLDTSDWVKLTNANGIMMIIQEDFAVDANPLTLTVHEGATGTGTTAVTNAFQIWTNLTSQTNDTFTRETDAITYVVPAGAIAGDNIIVIFCLSASILQAGNAWVQLGASAGNAGNTVSVTYILDGARYQQATPPTAVA